MKFIDVHTHLHDKAFDEDRAHILLLMEQADIGAITVGTDLEESKKAVKLAEENEHIWATVGMHPVDNRGEDLNEESYKTLLAHPKVVALGECGLDYYRLDEDKEKGFITSIPDEKERQRNIFQRQIELAVEMSKPLMLHGRPKQGTMDAYKDMLQILEKAKQKYGGRLSGNAHFFAGDKEIAERFLNIGFTMSFSGVITFAKEFEEVIRFLPITSIHAETDSPYASPLPERGKRNSSLNIVHIANKIAEIKGIPEEEVRTELLRNAQRIFKIDQN